MKILALLTATACLFTLGACSTCPAKTASSCCGASGSMKCEPAKPQGAVKAKAS